LISTQIGPTIETDSILCPDRSRTTNSWLVGPHPQCYIEEVRAMGARMPWFAVSLKTHLQTLADLEGRWSDGKFHHRRHRPFYTAAGAIAPNYAASTTTPLHQLSPPKSGSSPANRGWQAAGAPPARVISLPSLCCLFSLF